MHDNVFLVAEDDLPATTCSVDYRIFPVDATHFGAVINVTNNTNQTIFDWTLRYQYSQGQALQIVSGAIFTQSGAANNGRDVTATAVGRQRDHPTAYQRGRRGHQSGASTGT